MTSRIRRHEHVQFAVRDDILRIEGGALLAPGQSEVRVDDLTAQILAAVVDEWDFSAQDGLVRFACTRRVPEPTA